MVVVENHEHKSKWWEVTSNSVRSTLYRSYVTTVIPCPPNSLCTEMTFKVSMNVWPDVRAAVDALYAVWQEQQEAGE